MKNFLFSCLFAVALCAPPVAAQIASAPGVTPLRVRTQSDPVYPFEMVQIGVREGKAVVAISVDAAGRIDDCLAVAYTQPEFAHAALSALRHWTFEPARYRGEPVAAMTEVTVNFEVQGTVVVSMTSAESMAAWMAAMHPESGASRPRLLRELDRIPTPIVAVPPRYPADLAQKGRSGKVTVQFYIDENGTVRMPSVSNALDLDLGALAVSAVQQWRFEPPTCEGRAVLVRAEQVFDFKQAEAAK
ncbi:MAG TPA: energy transducer TonB [Opitutaceae bacterium]|nr:energy transducer TonB [Opitutaceae bacterium]